MLLALWASLAVLLLALCAVRRRRLRIAPLPNDCGDDDSGVGSMRETLARRIQRGDDFGL
ncbi:hypothetical protein GVO57_08160 [Sphingomonas changnyeongensis]|uniref:Uncharacterized protein n=1 Tax=Sphingomonas changnyeongensis TaxID=2698679 RepID=A0A7Z2NWT6_9SPHN|nr:hypothetical protein [Sphingomonas changnyeongensis]QHL90805.1 hypothetical protein GVO57_08160 [Sphingomonas changnyeongensis]